VNADPHRGQPVLVQGPDPAAARLVVVAVHGRGASAGDILSLATELDRVVGDLAKQVPRERIGLMGFSQGACLSLEYAARHARRYGAIVGLSGAVIGPPGTPRRYAGSMDATPAFLGCSDVDPHIPLERVHETAEVYRRLGASVDERIYPRMGHLVNRDEIDAARALLSAKISP